MQLPKVQITRGNGSTYGDDMSQNVKEDIVMTRHTTYSNELKVSVNIRGKNNGQEVPTKPVQQKMVQRGDNGNDKRVGSGNKYSDRGNDNRGGNFNGTASPYNGGFKNSNDQGRDLLKEAAVFMGMLDYRDISGRLKRMSHFNDGDEMNVDMDDFKKRCRQFVLKEFNDIEIKKAIDFSKIDQKYFNPEIPEYTRIDKENDTLDVIECKIRAIDAWYLEQESKAKPNIPDINNPNAVWAPPTINTPPTPQEPVDPKMLANQLHIERGVEEANKDGSMEVQVKEPEEEVADENVDNKVVSDSGMTVEMNGKTYHKAEYFDKKEVVLEDKAEDLTSATDRAKIKEFMMDETSDFLDGFDKDSASDAEIKDMVEEYLTEQCITKYSKSDPAILKVMIKEFVEEFHGEIADTIHDEAEKKNGIPQPSITVEELQNIEY